MKLQYKSGMYGILPPQQPDIYPLVLSFNDEGRPGRRYGGLIGSLSRWHFFAERPFGLGLARQRVCVDLVGLGTHGPIISIVSTSTYTLCEMRTEEVTGRTNIIAIHSRRFLRPMGSSLPLARRRQAAKLASLKMIETIRLLKERRKGVASS